MPQKPLLATVLVLLGVGIYARFADLAWHFANVDDLGVAEIILKNRVTREWGLFPIPRFYTYAPFQFLFTPFLISDGQPYRDLLFWGRLPSCVAGIAGFFALLGFYKAFRGRLDAELVLPLALLACSWENIIYAKQMHNYALGVTACAGLAALYVSLLRPELSPVKLAAAALAVSALSHMHYQILIFSPAFFLGLFLFHAKPGNRLRSAAWFGAAGLLFLVSVFPLHHFFLSHHVAENAGMPASGRGPGDAFALVFPAGTPPFRALGHAALFFARNLFWIFQAHTAFLAPGQALAMPAAAALFALFLAGAAAMLVSGDAQERGLGLFVVFSFLAFGALVARQKLTFGPTRHTLVLLPFLAILTGRGATLKFWPRALPYAAAAAVTIAFGLNYGRFLEMRRDPFDEHRIAELLRRYEVDTVFTNRRTDGLGLMPEVEAYQRALEARGTPPHRTLAWISKRDAPFASLAQCEQMRAFYNMQMTRQAELSGKTPDTLPFACGEYRLVYRERKDSDVQADYAPRSKIDIYTNSFYFYIVTAAP